MQIVCVMRAQESFMLLEVMTERPGSVWVLWRSITRSVISGAMWRTWALDAVELVSSSLDMVWICTSAVSMYSRLCCDCVCTGVGVLSGQLYAAGGHDGPLVRKSVEVYDPASNSWRQVCDMNMCRRNAGETFTIHRTNNWKQDPTS